MLDVRIVFSMSLKTHFFIAFVLLFLLHITNHGQAAPVPVVTEDDLLEGDMVIDQAVWDIVTNQSAAVDTKRSAVTSGVRLWPNGIVPYVINSKLSYNAKTIIQQAFGQLHASTCIRFRPRKLNEYHYVEFIKGNGCYSYVGRKYGRQCISLGLGCESVGTALHEMLHALGFFHTSSRTDRDAYVIVNHNNIETGKIHNFYKYSHGQIDHLNSHYDITSIMHLPRYAFSKSPYLRTIEARAGPHIKLGETGKLSPIDKYQLNALYKCSSTTSSSSCLTQLGLTTGAIPDKAITASSQLQFYSPGQARLHKKSSSQGLGAWCPKIKIDSWPWLEIDLGQKTRVTGIATQGLKGMFNDEYTPKYDLWYRTYRYSFWYTYLSTCRAYDGAKSLPGNWDGGSVQYNALSPTFVARYVRLYPKSWIIRPCFRVEFYGCKI